MGTTTILQAMQTSISNNAARKAISIPVMDTDNAIKQQITDQVFPPSERSGRAGFNAGALQVITDALNNGFIRQYYSQDEVAADCAQARSNPNANLQIATQAGSIAKTGLGILGTVGVGVQVVPVVGQIIGVALSVFGAISKLFAHHKLAVQEEQTILCSVVPAFNKALSNLDAAIASGTITIGQANDGLNSLQNAYLQQVQPILKYSTGSCNASCVIDRAVIALCLYRSYKYTQQLSGTTCAACNVTSSSLANITNTFASNPFLVAIVAGLVVLLLAKAFHV